MSPQVRFGLAVVALMAAGAEGRAQAIRVRARQEGDRRPIVGVLVSLRDAVTGRVVRQVLTDENGRALVVTAPGRYVIRADRIGYPGSTTEPFSMTTSDTVAINLVMSGAATTLTELEVVSSAPVVCALAADAAGPVAMLWTEARKALAATDLTARRLPLLDVTRYERVLGPGSVVTGEHHEQFQTDSLTPFIAADPADLARDGYLERRGGDAVFYAPDARVLLSDEFVAGHCFFGLAAADGVGLVGLGFEPAAGPPARGADIRGALWLDRATFELRFLEFSYTNLPRKFQSGHDGGRVDFVRLPGGGWLTSRWRVRVADRERGGEVVVVGGRRDVAVLTGQATDSLAEAPLAGAVISVAGGAYGDTTEVDGRYRIEIPMAGDFAVTLSHPVVGLVGGTAGRTARLALGTETVTDFGVPSRASLEAGECPRRLDPNAESLLVGRIVDSAGRGQIGSVRIGWPAGPVLRSGNRLEVGEDAVAVTVVTDSDGRFRVCGVPAEVDPTASAAVGTRRAAEAVRRVGRGVGMVQLVVP